MLIKKLRAKIHRAVITEAQLEYVGSITIDRDLLDATGIVPGEAVVVADLDNGDRFETYVFEGPAGSGTICINGAAARRVHVGDRVIIMAYGYLELAEAASLEASVVLVDDKNRIIKNL